jgi:anti-anti-sigma factor
VARLALHGELDAATAPSLEAAIRTAAGDGTAEVVVDCSSLEFIDSSGLSVLVANHKRLADAGGELVIEAAPPAARRLFEIAGIDRVLNIRDSR